MTAHDGTLTSAHGRASSGPCASVKLVLADTFPMFLEAMARVFNSEPGFHVLACCQTGDEVLRAVRAHRPDLVVLDLDLSQSGLIVLRQIIAEADPPRVVVMAATLDEHEMFEAMRLGARGILLKTMTHHLVIQCARKVHGGEIWFERVSMAKAVQHLFREETASRQMGTVLTHRELEIVRLVAAGRATKDIAGQIGVAEGTVKVHLHHVYEKLGVKGRLELTLYARDQGMFSPLLYQSPRRTPA